MRMSDSLLASHERGARVRRVGDNQYFTFQIARSYPRMGLVGGPILFCLIKHLNTDARHG